MTDPRDDLDAWLEAQVHPLPPPPGTFELIRRRARRRKVTRAAVAAAGAAAVITLIAAVPTLIIPRLQPGGGQGQRSTAAGQTLPASPGQGSATPSAAAPTPTPAAAQAPVPPNFAATSVTFIGTLTGWVIGQAGTPGDCAIVKQDCTSIARTDDGGATWYGVHAPVTGAPDGSSGVSQIRFLNRQDGWAFGPQLFATEDGGQTWTHISTGSMRVTDLETRGDRAFAVWAQCTGTGSDFAAGCTSFAVYSAVAGSDAWVPVAGATAAVNPGAAASTVSLLLTGTSGYLLAPSGNLLSGPVSGQGPWQPLSTPGAGGQSTAQCAPNSAQPDGQPAGGMLAATSASGLVLLCTGQAAGGTQVKTVYTSSDSGAAWQLAGSAPAAGVATSVAGTPSGAIVIATNAGIEISADGGASWTAAAAATPPGGFAFVGMTTSSQGVAVPADSSQDAVWFTVDGGHTWQASPVR
jgi:hypothetical protein